MQSSGAMSVKRVVTTLGAALALVLGLALSAYSQDPGAEQPAQPTQTAPKAKKGAKAAPAQPKAGEVLPLDQPADQAAAPAPAKAAAPGKTRPEKGALQPAMAKPRGKGQPLTLGALLPLTGALAAQGQSSKAALDFAVEDINAYYASVGSDDRVTLLVEDTQSAPAKALAGLKALAAAGARLVVGPYSDDEVDAVLDYSAKNNLVLLSQGSAGPYLSKRTGNLLRFAPSDAFQGEAIAVLASQEGCTHIVTIWEGDMYGDELVTHIKGQFANQGGQVIAGTRFRPEVTQFATYVADLKSQIEKNVKDKKQLGIVIAARGPQTAGILREAAKLGGLEGAKWYGGDDSALRGAVIKDEGVAKFASQVRIAFARYGETGTKLYSDLEKRIEDKIGAFADTQSLVAYDIAWLCATASQAATDDGPTLKKALLATAERFYGVTGWLAVNEVNDRREDYDYDFWTIRFMEGKYFWVKTARYQNDPGSGRQLILNGPDGADK